MDLRGQKLGQYELREQLGQGGMAQVYKAFQPGLERFVAVKVMLGHLAADEEFIERFRREARAVGTLRHPHIVNVFDFGIEDNGYYMVMEFIKGENLKAYINAHPQGLPIDEALRIASQIASALDYAHNNGMIHRDVKPANIMFVDDTHRETVLTDFGIAHILSQPGLTASGAMVGTPAYLSPDAAYGKNVDERADIYGLGIILYEMLTGSVPYNADTPMAIIMKHVNAPLPSRADFGRELPEVVEAIVLKAMQKKAEDRYQTAAEMQAALDKARSNLTDTKVHPVTPVATVHPGGANTRREDSPTTLITPKPTARSPLLWVGGLVILALVVVIVALLSSGGSAGSVSVSVTQVLEPTAIAAIESATDESTDIPPTEAIEPTIAPTDIPPTATIEPTIAPTDVPPTTTLEPTDTDVPPTATIAPTDEPLVVANVPDSLRGSPLLSGLTPLQDEIDAIILQGNTDTAFERLENILEAEPENIDALTALSLLETWEGDAESGLDDANQVIELAPDSPLGYIARSDALRHWSVEDWEGALEAGEKALELDSANPEILWRISHAQDGLGEFEAAAENLRQAVDREGKGFRFIAHAGEYLYYDGDYERAVPYLRSWYEQTRNDYILTLLTGALVHLNRPDDAYAVFQSNSQPLIQPAELRSAAFAAFKAGQFDAARDYAETARALADDAHTATYILGLVSWYGDHDLDAALGYLDDLDGVEFYDDLLSLNYGHELNLDRGNILLDAGENRAALGAFEDALDSIGGYPFVYERIADAYVAMEQPNAARDALRHALDVTGDDPEMQVHLTTRIREVTNVIAALPDTFIGDVNLLSGLTPLQDELDTLYLQGDFDAVRERITSILADDPENIEALTAQSLFQTLNDNPRLASRVAADIVRTYPESPLGYIALSDAQRQWPLENYRASLQAAERALAIDPVNPEALWRVALGQANIGNWDAFIDLQDRAIANGARGFRFAQFAGEYLLYREEFEQALPYLQAWYARVSDIWATGFLAADLMQLDEIDAAYEIIQRFSGERDNPEALAWSAYVAYVAEDYDQALEWAEEGVRQFPDARNTRYIMGLLKWHADDDLDGALAFLDQLADIPEIGDLFISSATGHQVNYDRGLMFLDAGEIDAAIEAFQRSLEQDARWYTYEALAEAYVEQDNIDAARDSLESALELTDDPDIRDELQGWLDELE